MEKTKPDLADLFVNALNKSVKVSEIAQKESVHTSVTCKTCGELPQLVRDGFVKCSCGTTFDQLIYWGVQATPQEEARLEASGFNSQSNDMGQFSYGDSHRRLITFFKDGTFYCDPPATPGRTLNEVLNDWDQLLARSVTG